MVQFDDVQWGEQTLLDLIEGVALLSAGAPLLVLCVARPELLERRPAWPVAVRLGPLPEEAVEELIGDQVTEELRGQIAAAAGGNPLFVTEMLSMAGETDEVEVPPTLRALLSARLDQLDPAERRVLECGSVEGEVFHRGGVQALAPEESHVTPRLAALVRRELIRSDRPVIAGDDGFRFRHLLIRDAAYDALPKAVRAELHERFAGWLELARCRAGRAGRARRLPPRTGGPLPRGAGPARSDARATRRRPSPGSGAARARQRGRARRVRAARAFALADTAAPVRCQRRARPRRRQLARARASCRDLPRRRPCEPPRPATRPARRSPGDGRPLPAHGRSGLARRARDAPPRRTPPARAGGGSRGAGPGLVGARVRRGEHARPPRRLGDGITAGAPPHPARRPLGALADLGTALVCGSRPADEALEISIACSRRRLGVAAAQPRLAARHARSRRRGRRSPKRRGEAPRPGGPAGASGYSPRSRPSPATTRTRAIVYASSATGSRRWSSSRFSRAISGSSVVALPARSLQRGGAGRGPGAGPRRRARSRGWSPSRGTTWRQVLARVGAHRGELAEAERLAREAVAMSERNDSLDTQCLALWDLAEVLAAAQRPDEAADVLEQALNRCRRKKNLALATQASDASRHSTLSCPQRPRRSCRSLESQVPASGGALPRYLGQSPPEAGLVEASEVPELVPPAVFDRAP